MVDNDWHRVIVTGAQIFQLGSRALCTASPAQPCPDSCREHITTAPTSALPCGGPCYCKALAATIPQQTRSWVCHSHPRLTEVLQYWHCANHLPLVLPPTLST